MEDEIVKEGNKGWENSLRFCWNCCGESWWWPELKFDNTRWNNIECYDVAFEVMSHHFLYFLVIKTVTSSRREDSLHLLTGSGKVLEVHVGLEILLLTIFGKCSLSKGWNDRICSWMWGRRKGKESEMTPRPLGWGGIIHRKAIGTGFIHRKDRGTGPPPGKGRWWGRNLGLGPIDLSVNPASE